jgi:SNF2 family DNA or RNA helicase
MPFDSALDWTHRPFPNGQTLKPHQRTAAEFLLHGRFSLLALKPRLGKTYVSLATVNMMCSDFGGTVVIVCPAGLRASWRSKIEELREGNWRYVVVSYNDLAAGKDDAIPAVIDILIVDEAHFLKNKDSQRTQAVLGIKCDGVGGIAARARFVWALTGTPMPNNPSELWPMLRCFYPKAIWGVTGRPMSFGDFRDWSCSLIATMQGRRVVGGKRLPELKRRMAEFTLVMGYDVLPGVPKPPAAELMRVEVPRSEARAIKELENSPEGRAVRNALATGGVAALSKLGVHGATLRRMLGMAKVTPVVDLVEAQLERDPDLKIVVFAYHQEVVGALKARFSKWHPAAFIGGLTPDRQEAVKRQFWRDPKCRVLVASLVAAAEGHDFSCADMAIRAETAWVPATNEQADMRIWNTEKKRPLDVKAVVLKGTIDEDIISAVEQKSRMSVRLFGA